MPLNLVRVAYDPDSSNELVRKCLERKKQDAEMPGRGPHSCCAMLQTRSEYGGRCYFGNSQERLHTEEYYRYKDNRFRTHGEACAVTCALNDAELQAGEQIIDVNASVDAIYIELSPCQKRCQPFLENICPDATIYYSYDHGVEAQMREWREKATALCKGR